MTEEGLAWVDDLELIPFVDTSDSILYDHNRASGSQSNYPLSNADQFSIYDDFSKCPAPNQPAH